jgi:hypothetical protein
MLCCASGAGPVRGASGSESSLAIATPPHHDDQLQVDCESDSDAPSPSPTRRGATRLGAPRVIQTPSPGLDSEVPVVRVRVEDAFQSSSAPPTAAVARAAASATGTGRTGSPSQPEARPGAASDGVSELPPGPSHWQPAAVGARTAGPGVESQSVGGISTPGLLRALEGPLAGPDSDSPFGQPQPASEARAASASDPGPPTGTRPHPHAASALATSSLVVAQPEARAIQVATPVLTAPPSTQAGKPRVMDFTAAAINHRVAAVLTPEGPKFACRFCAYKSPAAAMVRFSGST